MVRRKEIALYSLLLLLLERNMLYILLLLLLFVFFNYFFLRIWLFLLGHFLLVCEESYAFIIIKLYELLVELLFICLLGICRGFFYFLLVWEAVVIRNIFMIVIWFILAVVIILMVKTLYFFHIVVNLGIFNRGFFFFLRNF